MASVTVQILGDSTGVERAFARASKSAKDFNRDLQRGSVKAELGFTNLRKQALGFAGGYLAVGTAAAAVTAGLKSSVDAASNLNEQIAKSEVVFGDANAAIEAWSKNTARSIGIAQDEALAAAGTFGNLFVTMGIGETASADMSRELVQLAADLAAFNNTRADDALLALRSGLVGEAEPLRRYGVRLSEARVQQEAMAETGKRNAKSLTEQEKAMARYRIILDDTVTAQGNFEETSEEFAQQVKILRAELRDLPTTLGNALIPKLTEVVTLMNDIVQAGPGVVNAFREIADMLPLPDPVKESSWRAWKEIVLRLNPATATYKNVRLAADLATAGLSWFREEAAKPLEFDFSALNQLTQGLMTAGLAAKDAIERRGLGEPPAPPKPATAEQRNTWWDAMIGRRRDRVQDIRSLKGQLAELRDIARDVREKRAATRDPTRRLTLEDLLLDILRDQRQVQADIADEARAGAEAEKDRLAKIKAANEALKDRAQAIKSAVIERLQRKQTDILNKRALADAQEQLRIARYLGGPEAIRAARRQIEDVRFDMRMARLEAAPATLTKGGQFALGGMITINVNGVTDPDAVARKVAEVLQRRGRRTTTQTRGANAGAHG